ncbi:WYL domain-containing transcriptional regulator [bacterium]|nr:WYL domain-containing transcriptional regulator [bacterium]
MDEESLSKFHRLLRLLNRLSNPAGVSVKQLAESTGVDIRTAYRDLDDLRDACFDIVQVRARGPYRLSGDYSAMGQTLTLEEVLCLGLASCLLQDQIGNVGRDAMLKLQHFVKGEKRQLVRDVPSRVEIQPGQDQRWIPQLMLAVSQRRQIRFEYNRGYPPQRTMEPYTLFYQDERWYVQGLDPLRGALRRFRLTRITSLEVLPYSFTVPDGYDSKAALFHKWDIAQHEPMRVRCRVSSELCQWLEENPVHPTQRLHDDEFTLQVRDLEALAQWLLGLQGLVVIEPEALRVLIREKAQGLAQKYSV